VRYGLFLLLLLPHLSVATTTLTLCEDSESVYPWTMPNRPGLNRLLLESTAKELNLQLLIVNQPWLRCQDDLKNNKIDGMYPISFNEARDQIFAYPKRNGKLEAKHKLMDDGYSLYRLNNDQSVQWDGKQIKINSTLPVGVQRGYSIAALLKKMGVAIDDGAYPINANLQKLQSKRIAAIALRTSAADFEIAAQLRYLRGIEKLHPPLEFKPYFLVFSKNKLKAEPELVQEFWQTLAKQRESQFYQSLEENYR
jgi:polar amino acid transport system substrate-binding protein